MKNKEDKRLAVGAVMLAVFTILIKAVKWLCVNGWWPLVMAYVPVMVCLMVFSADMTPMEEEQ